MWVGGSAAPVGPRPARDLPLRVRGVEDEGALLKIVGLYDAVAARRLEVSLAEAAPRLEAAPPPRRASVAVGTLLAVIEGPGLFRRAWIVAENPYRVRFLDDAGERIVTLDETRLLNDPSDPVVAIPPQRIEPLLARVAHPRGRWDAEALDRLRAALVDKDVAYAIEFSADERSFVGVKLDGADLSDVVVRSGFAVRVDAHEQLELLERAKRFAPAPAPAPEPEESTSRTQAKLTRKVSLPRPLKQDDGPAAYSAPPLEIGSRHRALVSYAKDGPGLFAVQLESDERELIAIMKRIEATPPKGVSGPLNVGAVCLGKFSEDHAICRALVTGFADSKCLLYFVDFGMTEAVPYDNIYRIPKEIVAPRVLAYRFSLSGVKELNVDDELKETFHSLVHEKILTLRVLPPEDPPVVQYCELFLDGRNVKDLLKSDDPSSLRYERIPLADVANRSNVTVSFVDSCTNFFVQLAEHSDRLERLMSRIEKHCANADSMMFHEIKNGTACCALYPDDGTWYRALVTNIKKDKITVNYVDYGNDHELTADNIKRITRPLLTLPVQALHCALKGYEDKPFCAKLSSKLEELTVENEFVMSVHGTVDSETLLVDLINDKVVPSNVSDQLKQFEAEKSATTQEENVAPSNFSQPEFEQSTSYSSNNSNYNSNKKYKQRSTMDERLKIHAERDNDNYKSSHSSQRDFTPPKDSSSSRQDFTPPRNNYSSQRDFTPRDNYSSQRDFTPKDNYSSQRDFTPKDNYSSHQDFTPPRDDYKKKRENPKKDFHPHQQRKERDNSNFSSSHSNRNNFKGHSDKKRNTSNDFPKQNHRWNNDSDRPYKSQGKRFDSQNDSYSQDRPPRTTKPSPKVLSNPAPYGARFEEFNLGASQDVRVSWIVNPNEFHVHILSIWSDYEALMSRVPTIYKDIKPSSDTAAVGVCILALDPEDNSVYRAEIVEVKSWDEYVVYFVDFGNTRTIAANQMWTLDNELLSVPKLSVRCSLKGILPANGKWSEDCQEDKFFTDTSYRCDFISKSSNTHLVTLTNSNGVTIQDILINENLAISSDLNIPKYEGEKVEINILVGQNIHSQITRIDSINKFYICIDPFVESFDNNMTNDLRTDKPIECSLHNYVPGQSQLIINEDGFKSFENKHVIIYVDGVEDGRLLVTLYEDKTGFKIECFTPDEGAYGSIPVICAHPVFSQDFGSAYTTHIESVNEIYLHRNKSSNLISCLLDMLYNFYSSEGNSCDLNEFEVESICAANSNDGNWYRAKIIEAHSDECKVQYIDYGNSETVSKTSIKALDAQFYQFYEQAIVCALTLEKVTTNELKTQLDNQDLVVSLRFDEIGWVSSISIDGVDIFQTLNKTNGSYDVTAKNDEIESLKKHTIPKSQNDPISVLVSHIDSPGQFWIQLTSEADDLAELCSKIETEVQNLEDLQNCDIGKTCIAKYSADDQYYRAVILDSDSDIITVRFTDYGNTDVLDNTPGHLKCLPESLVSIKPYATKCSVNAFPASMGEWSETATSLFTQSIGDKEIPVEATIVLVDSTTYVDICANGVNITEKLVDAGYAVLNEKQDNGELPTCFTSHINSPSEFWVNLESSVSDLELILEQLDNAESFPAITEIEEEVVCAAKYAEDGKWYRAKIIIHGSDGTEVWFMDYGNASLSDELRSLPENLKNIPALSRKCALQKPANIKCWSKEAELKFVEIAKEGATVFRIKFIATGDLSIVELYLDNESIADQLIPLCDANAGASNDEVENKDIILPSIHITCSFGPDNFWVQYNSFAEQLNTVMNTLMEGESFDTFENKSIGSQCISLFSEDNMWYRSEIISVDGDEVEVIHIDYGLTAKSNNLKNIPLELINIPPLAKNYRLLLPKNCDKFSDKEKEAFIDISAKQSQLFYVEIVDSTTKPEIVNLFIKQNNKFINIIENITNNTNVNSEVEAADSSCDKTFSLPDINPTTKETHNTVEATKDVNEKEELPEVSIEDDTEQDHDIPKEIANNNDLNQNVPKNISTKNSELEPALVSDKIDSEDADRKSEVQEINRDSEIAENDSTNENKIIFVSDITSSSEINVKNENTSEDEIKNISKYSNSSTVSDLVDSDSQSEFITTSVNTLDSANNKDSIEIQNSNFEVNEKLPTLEKNFNPENLQIDESSYSENIVPNNTEEPIDIPESDDEESKKTEVKVDIKVENLTESHIAVDTHTNSDNSSEEIEEKIVSLTNKSDVEKVINSENKISEKISDVARTNNEADKDSENNS